MPLPTLELEVEGDETDRVGDGSEIGGVWTPGRGVTDGTVIVGVRVTGFVTVGEGTDGKVTVGVETVGVATAAPGAA